MDGHVERISITMETKRARVRRILSEMEGLPRNLARMFEEEAIDALDTLEDTTALIERMQRSTDRLAS